MAAVLALAAVSPTGAAETGAGSAAAATRRGAASLAQERLDSARQFATDVAERMAAAQTQKANLEAEIAKAEAEIPALRAHADEPGGWCANGQPASTSAAPHPSWRWW